VEVEVEDLEDDGVLEAEDGALEVSLGFAGVATENEADRCLSSNFSVAPRP
jgi:hypothetical protein